jgi:hypothetical protein
MFIAIILQKQTNTAQSEIPCGGYQGKTLEDACGAAEKQAVANRKSNPGYNYRVVAGKVTNAVKPPEDKIEIVAAEE